MIKVEKIKTFFREVYVELRKVNWLSRRDVLRYTLVVISITIFVAAVLGGLDYLFSTILRSFILR